MLEDGVIPTVAPGQWRAATKPNDTTMVLATFAGSRDDAAVRVQLEAWLRALRDRTSGSRPSPVALPVQHEQDGAIVLEFDAPIHISPEVAADPAAVVQSALAFLRDAAAAIDALHAIGLVHGEIGPASFWRTADGRLVFPDAGLSHILAGIMEPPAASAAYRAPEVWRGRSVVRASDQYSLAVVAFELLSGRPRVVHAADEGLTSLEPLGLETGVPVYRGAPPQLTEVLQRALAASPAARFESCSAFVAALSGHVPLPKSLPTAHRRLGNLAVTRRSTMVLSVVAVVAVAAAATAVKRGIEKKTGLPTIGIDLPRVAVRGGTAPRAESSREGGGLGPSNRGVARPGAAANATRGGVSGASSGVASGAADRIASGAPGSQSSTSITPASRTSVGSGSLPGSSGSPRGGPSSSVPSGRTTPRISPIARSADSSGRSVAQGIAPSVGRALERAGAAAAQSVSRPTTTSSSPTSPRPAQAVASANGSLSFDGASRPDASESGSRPAPSPVAPTTGTVILRLTRGQTVYVDGVQTRVVSGRLWLPAGAHDIDIVAANGTRTRRRVSVVAGGTITVVQ